MSIYNPKELWSSLRKAHFLFTPFQIQAQSLHTTSPLWIRQIVVYSVIPPQNTITVQRMAATSHVTRGSNSHFTLTVVV